MPLSRGEMESYIKHRLAIAGTHRSLFKPSAVRLIQRITGGVPRRINILCDRALLGAYVLGKDSVDIGTVRRAAREVDGNLPRHTPWSTLVPVAAAVGILLSAAVVWTQLPAPDAEVHATALSDLAAALPPPQLAPVDVTTVSESTTDASPWATLSAQLPSSDRAESVVEPEIDLSEVLTHPADPDAVFQQVFARWEIQYSVAGSGDVCDIALAHGLNCLEGNGTWSTIRQYDRPTLLHLRHDDGTKEYVLVTSVQPRQVTIQRGTDEFTLSYQALERVWFGRFLVFWRPPIEVTRIIKQGQRGADVLWLRKQLDHVDGIDHSVAHSTLFDAALTRRVQDFQRHHHLDPDGAVGARTLIQLKSAVADSTIPRLLPNPEQV
jgi:general secretion pathway protein A